MNNSNTFTPSTQVAILAGGKSTRMKSPLPKILHNLHGNSLLHYVVDAAREANGTAPLVVVNPDNKEAIERVFKREITYVTQELARGTGHAVQSIPSDLLRGSSHLVVLYGDHPLVTGQTVRRLIEAHAASHTPVTIMTVTVPHFIDDYSVFTAFGRVVRTANGTLDRIVEYKDARNTEKNIKEVNPGYYCFSLPWLFAHLSKLKDNNAQREYYLTDLIGMARGEGEDVVVVPIDDPFEGMGVNTPEEFAQAEKIMEKRLSGAVH